MGDKRINTLTKRERLHDSKLIEDLFKSSDTFKSFPIIFNYKFLELPLDNGFSFIVTVSKRKFKRAVDRNRIRRIIKESLRLLKHDLNGAIGKRTVIGALIYTSKELPTIEQITISLNRIIRHLNETNRS